MRRAHLELDIIVTQGVKLEGPGLQLKNGAVGSVGVGGLSGHSIEALEKRRRERQRARKRGKRRKEKGKWLCKHLNII